MFTGIAYFFYNASLPAAKQYGNMIRSAYDLFRFDLRKQLRLTMPPHSNKEHDSWQKWTEFVSLGSFAPKGNVPFLYQYNPEEIGRTLMSEDDLYRPFSVTDEEE